MKIDGSIALVTGASSGIGAATAVTLARRGATVVAVARRADKLDETIAACGGNSMAHAADLGVTGAGAAAVDATLQRFGRVDIVVNNAGISLHQRVANTSFADVAQLTQVNFLAAVEITMEALPGMLERGRGYVMNVTSVAGFVPNPKEAAYGASKAALHRWSHGLAIDLAGTGVHVGELSPGPIDTEIWDGEDDDYTGKKYSPQVVADAIAAMVEGDEVHRTVPRHFGAVGAMYPLPGIGRAMRRGLVAFGRRQTK